jgi:hypothetical protein
MAAAGDEGIPLEDYIKVQPEPLVRTKLDRRELRYTWIDASGIARASDDGGPQPPKGWWTANSTTIDRERREVRGNALFGPAFPMFFVRVHSAVTAADAPAKSGPLSTRDWLVAEAGRRKEAGDIPTGPKAVDTFSEELAAQMSADLQAGKCCRAISIKSIRARLYDYKLWPVN